MKDKHGTLQVRGTGELRVSPDEAIVDLQVITEAKTATEAVEANARRTQAVVDAVAAEPNHGITTTGLGVSPIVSYDNNRVPTIVGFRATNGVEVKTKVGYAGRIYDAGVTAGANQSSGISFRVQNETPHREEALRLATKHAYREASIVAKVAGVELEGPEAIEILSADLPIFYRAAMLEAASPPTPVIPGDTTITASVMITFRTKS